MIIVKQDIKKISLDFFDRYRHCDNLFWDKEHYRLLAYLTSKFNKAQLIDAGTCTGHSCLALAQNKSNTIISYDINPFNDSYIRSLENVFFFQKDILKEEDSVILKSELILLDVDPHDGIQEKQFTDKLEKIGYKGLLLCDDIHLNQGMENWWQSISNKKLDLTEVGHGSGTGLVIYGNQNIEVV